VAAAPGCSCCQPGRMLNLLWLVTMQPGKVEKCVFKPWFRARGRTARNRNAGVLLTPHDVPPTGCSSPDQVASDWCLWPRHQRRACSDCTAGPSVRAAEGQAAGTQGQKGRHHQRDWRRRGPCGVCCWCGWCWQKRR
jgi:hypothetical protein